MIRMFAWATACHDTHTHTCIDTDTCWPHRGSAMGQCSGAVQYTSTMHAILIMACIVDVYCTAPLHCPIALPRCGQVIHTHIHVQIQAQYTYVVYYKYVFVHVRRPHFRDESIDNSNVQTQTQTYIYISICVHVHIPQFRDENIDDSNVCMSDSMLWYTHTYMYRHREYMYIRTCTYFRDESMVSFAGNHLFYRALL